MNDEIIIKIKNLTKVQKLAIEHMLRVWIYLSNIGSSKYVCFFVDGDGNFHPEILVDEKEPNFFVFSDGTKYYDVKNNKVLIDFDKIAWDLR